MRQLSTPSQTNSNTPRLLNQVRDKIRLKHYSIRMEQAYCEWVKRFVLFHKKRHPKDMGAGEVKQFLTYLAVVGKVSASTQNQARETSGSDSLISLWHLGILPTHPGVGRMAAWTGAHVLLETVALGA